MIEFGINSVHLARQLSLKALCEELNLSLMGIDTINGKCDLVEFVCSNKRFGPSSNRFSEEQQTKMIDRFSGETGVYVEKISIQGTTEKGVDTTIAGKLYEYSNKFNTIMAHLQKSC
jgi:hypothetical protein